VKKLEDKLRASEEIKAQKTESKKSSGGGGSSGKAFAKEEASFRGLDVSRISQMVKNMFKDIQTMGFSQAYLQKNSPAWIDAEITEREREKKAYKLENEKREREAKAAKEEDDEEEETNEQENPPKLTKQKKTVKAGKELTK
jgi:hypothetical protein